MTQTASAVNEQFLFNVNATWDMFYRPSGVLEVRAILKSGGKHPAWEGYGDTVFGYFNNREVFVKCITALDRCTQVKGAYVLMNPAMSALLSRAQNRLIAAGKRTALTSDDDIVERTSILIDCDPFRPSEISSSQAELDAAIEKAIEISEWLYSLGFPRFSETKSGNGAHRIGAVELPNDDDAKLLVNDFLECLNWKFGTVPPDAKEAKRQFAQGIINVGIDTTVFNASRITKLYGSSVRKGDDTTDRPHRRAQLTYVAEPRRVIAGELLELVAQEYREYKSEQAKANETGRKQYAGADSIPDWCKTVGGVEEWLKAHNVTLGARDTYNSDGFSHKWSVDCLTSTAHKDGAVILWGAGKGMGYKCHHMGCKGKGWQDVRKIIDPDRKTYNGHASGAYQSSPLSDAIHNAPPLPEWAQLSEEEISEAATTGDLLREYVKFARQASPLTPDAFHVASGLTAISIAIARRLHVPVSTTKTYPNLYTFYVGPSTTQRKTTGMKVATGWMEAASMIPTFTLATRQTPEALAEDLSLSIPQTINRVTKQAKEVWLKRRALAAQRGWLLDEASHLLDSFNRDYSSGLLPMVLSLFESEDRGGERNTKSGGLEIVENAYLCVFGCTTYAAMSEHMSKAVHWNNGLFARFNLVCADSNNAWQFWPAPMAYPDSLVRGLHRIAYGLFGDIPHVALVEEEVEEDGKKIKQLVLDVGQLPDNIARFGADAWNSWERYSRAIHEMVVRAESDNSIEANLHPSYGRLGTTIIKVAMLLAACDAQHLPVIIERKHVLAAQGIVESWRDNLHKVRARGRVSTSMTEAEEIFAILARNGENWTTRRDLMRASKRAWKDDLEVMVQNLEAAGRVERQSYSPNKGPKGEQYRIVI